MLKNYIKIAWRNLLKYPVYSFLNIGGLALGIAAAFVLMLFVRQELTSDRHFADSERIYRVATDFFNMGGFAKSQRQLLDHLAEACPEIEQATRFDRGFRETSVVVGAQVYDEPHYFFVDTTFFQVFSYRFVEGREEAAMRAPDEAVLSEALAHKYFGPGPALGRVILVGKEKTPYRVSGVVAPSAKKTHLAVDLWLPLGAIEPETRWTHTALYTYVKLRPGATEADLERGLGRILRNQAYPASGSAASFEAWASGAHAVRFWVQPLTDIYLHSDYKFEIAPGGSPTQVYVLGLIGLLILLIAATNYVNLTTARSSIRAREVGMRKTFGAGRRALVLQFLAETVVFSLVAMILAVGLSEIMLTLFTVITGNALVESVFSGGWDGLALLGFSLGVGLLAGLYPAFYLSGFRPVKILKGQWILAGNQRLRGALVIVQFAIATTLIISSQVVYEQLFFMQEVDKGFEHEGVLVVENAGVLGAQTEAFRQQLAQRAQVVSTSLAGRTPTGSGVWMYTYQTPEMDEAVTLQTFPGDSDYLPTLGLRLVAGRNFSRELASDSSAIILNESAVRALGLGEEPLGKVVNEDQRVVGVVSDFNFQSLHKRIEPVVLTYAAMGGKLAVKLRSQGLSDFMAELPALWRRFSPDEPIRYGFVDDNFMRLADQERMLSRAVSFFTLLALVIAAMGLFGLTAFAVQRRTKEVGIRKVMGASVPALVMLLAKDFLRLVLVSFLLGAPAAYVVMRSWLAGFAYRIDLGASVFVLAGLLTLAVALLTVSVQAVRAALANPVKSLRYE